MNAKTIVLFLSAVGFLTTMLGSHSTWAQVSIPSTAEPSRLEENLLRPPVKIPSIKPKQDESQDKQPEIVDAEKIRILLNGIQFEGLKKFLPDELGLFYKDKIGKDISLADLQKIADRVQKFYADQGYSLTRVIIPEQDVEKGIITFKVIEGYVDAVRIDGDISEEEIVRAAAAEIKSMRPINVKKLERILLILNDRPGLNIAAILDKDGQEAEGALLLILKEEKEKKLTGTVSLSNEFSQFTGPVQVSVDATLAEPSWNYSSTNINATSDIQFEEVKNLSVTHSIPLFGVSGTILNLYGSLGRTAPGENLKQFDVRGDTSSFGAKISYPMIRQREKIWLLDGAFDFNQSKTDIIGDELINDRIRSFRVGSFYRFYDQFMAQNDFGVKVSQGINLFGASNSNSDKLSRDDGIADYTKIEGNYTRIQPINNKWSLVASAEGQYTNQPLLAGEEFGFGGSRNGKAYDPSELSGDRGISLGLEAQYTKNLETYQTIIQPYAFYELGKVWNLDGGNKVGESAANIGIGTRAQIKEDWQLDVKAAQPLTRDVDNPAPYTSADGPRVTFTLRRAF